VRPGGQPRSPGRKARLAAAARDLVQPLQPAAPEGGTFSSIRATTPPQHWPSAAPNGNLCKAPTLPPARSSRAEPTVFQLEMTAADGPVLPGGGDHHAGSRLARNRSPGCGDRHQHRILPAAPAPQQCFDPIGPWLIRHRLQAGGATDPMDAEDPRSVHHSW
jgi:hypothetical protein